jgi:hypothetical protein
MGSNFSLLGLMAVAAAIVLTAFAAATPATADPQTLEYSSTNSSEFTPVSHPARICCKRGRHDWWASPRACWRAGGHRVSAQHCRNDWNEVRVCCKRGRYDWWTTPRACANSGGYRVAGWQCRNG